MTDAGGHRQTLPGAGRQAGMMADIKDQPHCPDPPEQKGLDVPGGEALGCPGDG